MRRTGTRLQRCNQGLALSLCGALVTAAGPLGAQSDDDNARRHFESGAAYLQQSDNEDALREFQAAYSLSKRPALLLNIANVYERMGKLREAIEALTQYLNEDPKSADRTTTETRIANLQKRVEATPDAAPPVSSALPASSASPASSALPPAPAPSQVPTQAPAAPHTNRAPAYISWGVGGAAAVGAVITGLVARQKYEDAKQTCQPNCPDSTVSSIRSMAVVSDILTGVAVVGVGVGAVLFFRSPPDTPEPAPSATPTVQASVGVGAGKVMATWHF